MPSQSIPESYQSYIFDRLDIAKTMGDGVLVEKLPMQCWKDDEIDYTMAFLVTSKNEYNDVVNTSKDDLFKYLDQILVAMRKENEELYLKKYKNVITTINVESISAYKQSPSKEALETAIYAAFFQTLNECKRRNFTQIDKLPEYQNISTVIYHEEEKEEEKFEFEIPVTDLLYIFLLTTMLVIMFSFIIRNVNNKFVK